MEKKRQHVDTKQHDSSKGAWSRAAEAEHWSIGACTHILDDDDNEDGRGREREAGHGTCASVFGFALG